MDLTSIILQSAKQISQSQTDAYAASPSISTTIRQRDHELTEIAKSISELADLFRDIGNLVVEQGTVLDCVEYNVTETARDVKGAVEELKVATRCVLLAPIEIFGLLIFGYRLQVSKECWSPTVHLSLDSRHFRSHHRLDLQTA